ncbi:amidohydrolase family protein [Acidisoma cellulosilytica]|uniref:Amidohydrolase family protein n=1 Tax=Acidisoma cellulosilyticum TaxID=2802395 RepID=A0A963Z5P7_9PROT|nr:amidohydrolase family protein [Acidisoma cellulosilyticum]MCB8883123.1 amidohydrolase family protein [Acidisoma cellulosilyticum]
MSGNYRGSGEGYQYAPSSHETRIFLRGALILTQDPVQPALLRGDVIIEGDSIRAVGPSLEAERLPSDRVIPSEGQLIVPGLINAHFHSPANFLKGALDSLPLELFMLYEVPGGPDAAIPPRAAYIRTQLAAAEMLKLGITMVQDDAFFLPVPTRDEVDAVFSAYRDIGIRATVALDQPNRPEAEKLPFLRDLVPPALRARLEEAAPMNASDLLAQYDDMLGRWHNTAGGRLRAAVSCSAPQRVTEDYLRALDALSAKHDLPFYIHMLETRLQRVFGQTCLNGRSLIRYVDELGLLTERMNVIHAVWIDDDDIARLARSGAQVVHNPISNLRLGSGIMPFRRLARAGVPIALGSDEMIADDAVNLWSVVKLAGLVHNIGDPDPDAWPVAAEILHCLFQGGAQAARQADRLGRIAPGYQADLAMLDLDSLPFTPLNDLARQLVYCEPGRAVIRTFVAGEIVFEDGRLTRVDEAALRREARDIMQALAPKRETLLREASEWMPHYRAMYRQMLDHPVGMNRWVGDADPSSPGL